MKLSTAKRRINKTLDELTQSVIDDWYANFKNGYIKGYEDARQGKSPMYAEAYWVADTPQTERRTDRDGDVWEWRGDAWYCIGQANTPQTDCNDCTHWDYIHSVCVHQSGCNYHEREKMITPQTDCGWRKPDE